MLGYLSIKVAGGQLDLSNKYVGELPVPNFSILDPRAVIELAAMGRRISEGNVENWSEVDESVISVLSR